MKGQYLYRVTWHEADQQLQVMSELHPDEPVWVVRGNVARIIYDTAMALPPRRAILFLHGVVLAKKATQESLASDPKHT